MTTTITQHHIKTVWVSDYSRPRIGHGHWLACCDCGWRSGSHNFEGQAERDGADHAIAATRSE